MIRLRQLFTTAFLAITILSGCLGGSGAEVDPPLDPTYAALIAAQRDPAVPDLPFADNPDPSACGIPTAWGGTDNQAWLSGKYKGELIQPEVLLYDSHLRLAIETSAPHGTPVTIILFQENPALDYYYVKINGAKAPNEGWLPAPFLSFENPLNS